MREFLLLPDRICETHQSFACECNYIDWKKDKWKQLSFEARSLLMAVNDLYTEDNLKFDDIRKVEKRLDNIGIDWSQYSDFGDVMGGCMKCERYGDYSVFDTGKIYSGYKHRFLKLSPNKSGYVAMRIPRGNKRYKSMLVHRIIAQLFIPNPENKPCVNHKNGIKHDNRAINLEWCTYKENIDHAIKLGLFKPKLNGRHDRQYVEKIKTENKKLKDLLNKNGIEIN